MNIKFFSYLALTLLILSNGVKAYEEPVKDKLQVERQKVINQYLIYLQEKNYKDIALLFEKNAIVVSTSRGSINAKDFFYSFLPYIETANTDLHQVFTSKMDNNTYAARFNFTFKLKNGEIDIGEYIDEFIFSDYSTKIKAVYMFENLKFSSHLNSL